jgi:hypothetical protein
LWLVLWLVSWFVLWPLYPLSLFNKIDLNCYVFLALSNDKLLLIIFLFFGCSECKK